MITAEKCIEHLSGMVRIPTVSNAELAKMDFTKFDQLHAYLKESYPLIHEKLTLEIVDADGVFRGGAIAPGRAMMRRSLAAGTAQLPEIPFSTQLPEHPGSNTVETIRFGVDRGAVGLMRELLSASLPACGKARRPTIVATGRDSPFFAEALGIRTAPEDFTLRGILRAFLSRIS